MPGMIQKNVAVAIYGATPAGLLAAVAAARCGQSVLLIEPSRWLGGMIGGGIRITTDCEYPNHVGGVTRELLLKERMFNVWDHDAGQQELRQMWRELLAQYGIPVVFEHRLERVEKQGRRLTRLILEKAPPGADGAPAAQATESGAMAVAAEVFIDASYEGDLLARSGVRYTVGREGREAYGESLAGVRHVQRFEGIDPYRQPGDPTQGLLASLPADPLGEPGSASRFFIPFNFRFVRSLCQAACQGHVEHPAPAPGDLAADHRELVRRAHQAGHLTLRSSTNFNRRSPLTGSLPGLQADYPEGDWSRRAEIWRTLMEHDRLVAQVSGTALPLTPAMYPETGGWPHQLYIRMARRMCGDYVMTQADLAHQTDLPDSIGLGYYNVDIYPCRLVVLEDGVLATEGETWELVSPGPYPIPYRAITPRREECTNLLVPLCLSASHVACASIRMEPTFMILGESAGVAAAQAIDTQVDVQDLDIPRLQADLKAAGQILAWDGEGYGACWFNRPFEAWWQKHPEEYGRAPVGQQAGQCLG